MANGTRPKVGDRVQVEWAGKVKEGVITKITKTGIEWKGI